MVFLRHPQVAWQFQTPIRVPAVKQEVNPGIRSWKKHSSEWGRCQEAIGGIYFTKKWRGETLRPGLEFVNFKPRLESGVIKWISWLNGSFFWGWWSRFSERASQDVSNGTNVASRLGNFTSVFSSIVYGHDWRHSHSESNMCSPASYFRTLSVFQTALLTILAIVHRTINQPPVRVFAIEAGLKNR